MSSGDISVRQFLAVINDKDNKVKSNLFQKLGGDWETKVLHIQNSYYKANIGVKDFEHAVKISEAIEHEKLIPAVIVVYSKTFKMDTVAEVFEKEKNDPIFREMSKIVVCDNEFECMTFDLEAWSAKNTFELVYLTPTEIQKSDYEERSETYSYARIKEILDCTNWPLKDTTMEKISGNLELDRVLKFVYEMNDSGDEDNNLSPDTEAEEEIWQAFTMPQSLTPNTANSPEPMHAELVHLTSSSPTETDATSNVSLEIEVSARKPDESSLNISNQPIANTITATGNTSNQNKKKKKKKSKAAKEAGAQE